MHEKENLWCKILMAKYGDGLSRNYSVWWKDLLSSCVGPESGMWFENGLCRRIGDGGDTWFWTDNWHGKGKFKDMFAGLFAISEQRGKKLVEMGSWNNERWEWDLKWSASVEGENVLSLGALAQIISSFSLVQGRKDEWVWAKEGSGKYSVKSAYETIFTFELEENNSLFRSLWKSWAPSNPVAFGWRVLLNRIQTKANLIRRNIPIQSSACPWCGIEEESTKHLLFHCVFSWKVWSLILNWLGVYLVLPDEQKDHFSQFTGCWFLHKRNGLASIWLAVVWQLWIGRNALIFRGEEMDTVQIFEAARVKAWTWLRARNRRFIHSMSEWYNHPLLCLADM